VSASAPPDTRGSIVSSGTRDEFGAFVWIDEAEAGRRPAVAVKESIAVRGAPRRAGSDVFGDEPSPGDAIVVAALRDAGYAIAGTTAMNELAIGVSGDNHRTGPVLNPRDLTRIAGGSSSGSAAAVAAGLADVGLGTDTGGSVRIPAALCGVVGLKPRRDELSRAGAMVVSPTLDAVGILAADVAGAAKAFDAASGGAPSVGGSPREPTLAIPAGWLEGISSEALEPFLRLTHGAAEADFAPRREAATAAGTVSVYEMGRGLAAHLDDPRLGPDARELIERGASVSEAEYEAALALRESLRGRLEEILAEADALVVPTVPEVAPRRGTDAAVDRDRLTGWTRPFNLTDSAAVSVPLTKTGLPVAIQVIAASTSQALSVASWIERRSSLPAGGNPQ
jgi:Asp-tRNA(Asn)/Glu-tRNA(Gln) amidotransferase A subunit family amidase